MKNLLNYLVRYLLALIIVLAGLVVALIAVTVYTGRKLLGYKVCAVPAKHQQQHTLKFNRVHFDRCTMQLVDVTKLIEGK